VSYAIRGGDLIRSSLRLLGSLAEGEQLSGQGGQDALATLNQMVDAWGTEKLTIPFVARDVYDVVADQQTYTIGRDSADLDADRPPMGLEGAGLLLNASTPAVEISRHVMTDDEYQALTIKDLSSTLFTDVYYNATYPNGTIFLWPNPNTAVNSLVLYTSRPVAQFANLTNQYILPNAYVAALRFNLAIDLAPEWAPKGSGIDPVIVQQARNYKTNLKVSNFKPDEMSVPFNALGPAYNILTDTYT